MRRPVAAALALAAAALGAWVLWGWLWPDEAARVKAAADRLARTVTALAEPGGGVGQLAALDDLRELLAEDVVLDAPRRSLRVDGRDAVLALAAASASGGRRGVLSFTDVGVTVAGDAQSAAVTATAQVSGRGADGRAELDAFEVELEFVRAGGTWLLRRARTVDVLR